MRIGFYVSGNATRLQKIFSIIETGKIDFDLHTIGVIITDKENQLLYEITKNYNIPYYEFLSRKNFSENILEVLLKHEIKYLFLFAARILKGELLETYHNRIINFHPSLLPAFKGLKAIDQAIDYGAIITGNTAHFITSDVDNGPIIMHSIQPLIPFSGYDKVMDDMVPMFFQIYEWLKDNRIKIIDNKAIIENGIYKFSRFIPNLEIDINFFENLNIDFTCY